MGGGGGPQLTDAVEFALAVDAAFGRTLLQSTAPMAQRLTAPLLLQGPPEIDEKRSQHTHARADIVNDVQKQEEEIQTQLVPSLHAHTESIKAALSECTDVARLLEEWFNQPAQFALPNVLVDGQNMEQTLGRYRAAVV